MAGIGGGKSVGEQGRAGQGKEAQRILLRNVALQSKNKRALGLPSPGQLLIRRLWILLNVPEYNYIYVSEVDLSITDLCTILKNVQTSQISRDRPGGQKFVLLISGVNHAL